MTNKRNRIIFGAFIPSYIFPIPAIIIYIVLEPITVLYLPIIYIAMVAITAILIFIPSLIYSLIFNAIINKYIKINTIIAIAIGMIIFMVNVNLFLALFAQNIFTYPFSLFFIPTIFSDSKVICMFGILYFMSLALAGGVSSWLIQKRYKEDLKKE